MIIKVLITEIMIGRITGVVLKIITTEIKTTYKAKKHGIERNLDLNEELVS